MFKIYVILTLINGGFIPLVSPADYDTLVECNDVKISLVEYIESDGAENGVTDYIVECFQI